jgi:predicted O-methyltransferase YrrM
MTLPLSLPPTTFEQAWAAVADVPGWMTEDQGRALWAAAQRLAPGQLVLEIGSHQGRSTVILASSATSRGAAVAAVDPFVEGRLFGGAKTRGLFERNIARCGLDGAVQLHVAYSTELRPTWDTPLDLLYIDGKHDYWTLSDDLRWGEHLAEGGEMLVHDSFSSIGVTLGLLVHVLFGSRWVYVDRSRSLARFRKAKPSMTDRLRLLAQLPWWIRNVVIKVLLRLRLPPLARALGHEGIHDPF